MATTKHSQLIPGEDPEAFAAFAAGFTKSCNPADAREQKLVDQMIDDAWRLRRLRTVESRLWTETIGREATSLACTFQSRSESFLRFQRLVTRIKRSYHQTSADLDRLQTARKKN